MKTEISIIWCVDDLRQLGYECTDKQGSKILSQIERQHDANIGVNWDIVEFYCEENQLTKLKKY